MNAVNPTSECRWWLWAACLLPLVVSILFAEREVASPNVSSRMDTIQSLVEQHTFCIEQSLRKFEVDVVKIGGRFYSDKPPLLSVLGAGVYFPLHTLLGLSFAKHAPWLYRILTVILVGLPLSFGLWLLARCLFLAGLNPKAVATTVFLTGTGTMFLPYAVTFNNHVPAATAITAALYCMLRAESDSAQASRWLIAAGFAAALAFHLDLAPGGMALLGFGSLAFWREKRLRDLFFYTAGAIGPILIYVFLNWLVTRDFIPIYWHPEYYQYEGSVLLSYDALKRPYGRTFLGQLFHMFFGYRGFFLYSPILLFGLWETVRQVLRSGPYKAHALVALAIPILSACSYAMQTGGMAGGSYGMRWLLPATPLLGFFMGLAVDNLATARARNLFRAAAGLSVAIALIGVPRPWSSNIRSPFTFLDNLAYFGQTLWPPAKTPVYWIVELASLEKDYAYFEIGRWHMNAGFHKAAIADLEEARTLIRPERARALEPSGTLPDYYNLTDYYLGQCYDAAGFPDLAVEAYRRLLARDPRNTGAWNNYALSLRKLRLPKNALDAYQRSLDIDPNKVFTLRSIGQLYLEMGQSDQTARCWERALELEPRQVDLRRELINIYHKRGETEKALEHLRQLERLRPDDETIPQAIERLQNNAPVTSPTLSSKDRP